MAAAGVGQNVVTLDSSAIFALLNKKDAYHLRVRRVLSQYRPPYFVCTPALAEIAYLLETRLGHHVLNAFLEDIKVELFCLDFVATDIARVQELANKYQNLPLGLTDALVIACAERNGGEVLSLDEHFWIVSGEGKLKMHSLE